MIAALVEGNEGEVALEFIEVLALLAGLSLSKTFSTTGERETSLFNVVFNPKILLTSVCFFPVQYLH